MPTFIENCTLLILVSLRFVPIIRVSDATELFAAIQTIKTEFI